MPLNPKDAPRGYHAAVSTSATLTSCEQCAFGKKGGCRTDHPCFSQDRPDHRSVYFIKNPTKRIKQTRAKPTKVLVRWIVAYLLTDMAGKSLWCTSHFSRRKRARKEVSFLRSTLTASRVQIVRVAFEVKL